MAASANTSRQPKCGLRNDSDGLRTVLHTSPPSFHSVSRAASSTTTGQPKYGLGSNSDSLRSFLPTSDFDKLIPSASTFVASSSGTKHIPYHVFINHCGQDTKHTLASRIYDSLDATGLRVFLDKDELKLGDYFPRALEEAIRSASIYIAIFSQHYAQSPWCLAELNLMLQTGAHIIPIFYHVEPSDLRWAIDGNGKYASAFSEYERKNRYTSELQRWKESLNQASFYKGDIINNQIQGDEHRVVKNVVNLVMNKMSKVALEVAKFPVGLDEAVQNFNTFARQSAGSTSIVGIWGMGGSGKTTLAKEIFNKRRSAMDESSFLFDLRDAAGKGQLVEKQQKLLQDLKVNDVSFDHVDFGKVILNSRLRSLSVLIVLDDVDHIDQLDALLPPKESLGDGSLIIVTTRNADVLRQWGISAIYQMRPLNATHAKQLFCWHAFKQNSPPLEFEDLAEKFLNACQGLPLSLKVLGGQLYGRSDKNYWQRTFNQYSRIPHEDIKKKLKVSYDALAKQEKEMFLDTACFFIGYRKSAAIAAWDADWDGLLGWETLFNKCLVEEDGDGLIRMHDHLRDLGREIANGHSPHRLWSPRQVIEITPEQQAIQVRGMGNAIGDNCYQRQGKIIINTSQGERSIAPRSLGLKIFVDGGGFINQEHSEMSRDLLWLQCKQFKHKNLLSWLSLKKLRILEIDDAPRLEDLWEHDADAPLQLRELVIRRCFCLRGIQSLEHLKSLTMLNISNCPELEGLPGLAKLTSLNNLKLDCCHKLKKMEDLESITSLEMLRIYDCSELEGLPNLPELTLQKIELHECRKLKKIEGLGNLRVLKELDISKCSELEALPNLKENISLKNFQLQNCHELKKIEGLGNISLEKLRIYNCPELDMLPSLAELTSLETFELRMCHKLKKIEGLEYLRSLEELTIEDCSELEGLPSLAELSLKKIELRKCHKLKKIEGLENQRFLKELIISDCPELKALPSLQEAISLKNIQLEMCHKLEKTEGLENIISLERLSINDCPELDRLPSLAKLTSLKAFNLRKYHKLKQIEGLENIRSLENFTISDCPELEALPSLPKIASLKIFQLQKFHKLKKIEGLENLKSLEHLWVDDCSELDGLPGLAELTSLKEFYLWMCPKLKKIEGLENMKSLEELSVHDCSELDGLLVLAELTSLKELKLWMCPKLKKIEGLENIKSLEKLIVYGCSELDGLPGLAELTSLKEFDLLECPKLKKIEGLENIKSLEKLMVHDCSELDGLPGLAELTSLKAFDLGMCPKLKKLEFSENIKSLTELKINDCSELEALPSLQELTSLEELDLKNCPKLKIEGLERLRLLEKLELHTRWNAPCIVSLEHFESLETLVVVANHISAVEPFVSRAQKWPREVMICTRASCDVDSLKNFFEELPSVSVLDYSHTVEVDNLGTKCLELRRPESFANAESILICFTIDCVYPDLHFSSNLYSYSAFFKTELGEGKWVWMGVFQNFQRGVGYTSTIFMHVIASSRM